MFMDSNELVQTWLQRTVEPTVPGYKDHEEYRDLQTRRGRKRRHSDIDSEVAIKREIHSRRRHRGNGHGGASGNTQEPPNHQSGRGVKNPTGQQDQVSTQSRQGDPRVSDGTVSPAKYQRRPRRKTREDKYELKTGTGEKNRAKRKKKSRRKKTGAEINHNFRASNVASDRLTLRPEMYAGFLARGKASDHLNAGLPDLTFAELNFLSKRKQDSVQYKTANGRKDKARQNAVNDVSNYFSRAVETLDEHHLTSQPRADGGLAIYRQPTSENGLAARREQPESSIHDSLSNSAIHQSGGSTTHHTWSTSPERHHQPLGEGGLHVSRTPYIQRQVKSDLLSEQAILPGMLRTRRRSISNTAKQPEKKRKFYSFEDLKALAKAGTKETTANISPANASSVSSIGEPQSLDCDVDQVAETIIEDKDSDGTSPRQISDHQHRKSVPSHLRLRQELQGFRMHPQTKECSSKLKSQKHKREEASGRTAGLVMHPSREEARSLEQNRLAMLCRKPPTTSASQTLIIPPGIQATGLMHDDSHLYQFVGAVEDFFPRDPEELLPSLQEAPLAEGHHQAALYEPHAGGLHGDRGLAPIMFDGGRSIPILGDFSSRRRQTPTYGHLQTESTGLDDEELDDLDRQLLASDQAFSLVHAASERYIPASAQHNAQLGDKVRQKHAVIRNTPIIRLQEHHKIDALTHFWQPQIRY